MMFDFFATPTKWTSLLLNVILGLMVFYYASKGAQIRNLSPGSFAADQPLASTTFQNATENFLHFPIDFQNATAVFNSVYGAAKEKDSNLNPVGVNFFPAYVPANTFVYHGREDPNVPELFEWLAMDYEFSYSFASFGHRGPRKRPENPHEPGGPGNNPKYPGDPGEPERPYPGRPGPPRNHALRKTPPHSPESGDSQGKEIDYEKKNARDKLSYLLTFRTKHPLNKLILLDGASAAKSTTGEMDQQLILSQQQTPNDYVDEGESAERICKWGKPFGLQGVVRLEVGFEIILCDFHRDLELLSSVAFHDITDFVGFPSKPSGSKSDLETSRSQLKDRWQSMSRFEWMQTGANVNDGDGRILIDYSNMVTPLNKTWIDPDPYQRRINKIPQDLKDSLIASLETILAEGVDPFKQTNWPQIIGHVVDKFSSMLIDLNNTLTIFEQHADSDLKVALRNTSESLTVSTYNFIRRYSDGNIKNKTIQRSLAYKWAVEDYAHNTFEVKTLLDRLIYSSVYRVTSEVVSAIFEVHDAAMAVLSDFAIASSDTNYFKHRNTLLEKSKTTKALMEALGWSAFTKCTKMCAWNEVCAVPGWGPGPMGWVFGSKQYLHYERGSYRVNRELQCVGVSEMKG